MQKDRLFWSCKDILLSLTNNQINQSNTWCYLHVVRHPCKEFEKHSTEKSTILTVEKYNKNNTFGCDFF